MDFITGMFGGGILVASLGFLFRNLITHYLTKDKEHHKAKIQSDYKVASDRRSESYKVESEKLNVLWDKVISVSSICGSYDGDTRELEKVVSSLEEFVEKYEIYFDEDIRITVREFIEISDPDLFNNSYIAKMVEEKNNICIAIRSRLLME